MKFKAATRGSKLGAGHFCDLAHVIYLQVLSGHSGPPSNDVVTIGAEAAKQVQARPTTRINILIARCMGCFSLRAGSLGAETLTARDYTPHVQLSWCVSQENPVYQFG